MSISTYDDLVKQIRNWSNRKDLTDDEIQSFVYFAGSLANQALRVPAMENSIILDVTSDGHVVIPYDFQELRSLTASWNSNESVPLQKVAWDQYINFVNEASWNDKTPRFFARQGPYWFIAPAPNVPTKITCHYYRTMPDISESEQNNWLIDMSPMAYLYGSLHFLYLYVMDEERAAFWQEKYKGEIERIQTMSDTAEYRGTSLTVRSRTTQGANTNGL